MTVRIQFDPGQMFSGITPHTARQITDLGGVGADWTVSYLPGRLLTQSQATTAMILAEYVDVMPAGKEFDSGHWARIETWAAELNISGAEAVAKITDHDQVTEDNEK